MLSLTIHIAPAGTAEADGSNSSFGHMWYSIDDGNGHVSDYGFAPQSQNSPFGAGKISIGDNTNYTGPTTNFTVQISQSEYNTLQDFGNAGVSLTKSSGGGTITGPNGVSFNTYYNGLTNSCIDFTWAALATIGIVPLEYTDPTTGISAPIEGLIPSWDVIAIQGALTIFREDGGSSTPDPIRTYDNQGNLISTTTIDSSGNTILKDTFLYDINGDAVTDTTTNALGQIIGKTTESLNLITGQAQETYTSFSGSTGQQLNAQQITSTSNNSITDIVSGLGAIINLDDATINLNMNTTATVYGTGNTYTGGAGSVVTQDSSAGNSFVETFAPTSGVAEQLNYYAGLDGSGALQATGVVKTDGSGIVTSGNGAENFSYVAGDKVNVSTDVAGDVIINLGNSITGLTQSVDLTASGISVMAGGSVLATEPVISAITENSSGALLFTSTPFTGWTNTTTVNNNDQITQLYSSTDANNHAIQITDTLSGGNPVLSNFTIDNGTYTAGSGTLSNFTNSTLSSADSGYMASAQALANTSFVNDINAINTNVFNGLSTSLQALLDPDSTDYEEDDTVENTDNSYLTNGLDTVDPEQVTSSTDTPIDYTPPVDTIGSGISDNGSGDDGDPLLLSINGSISNNIVSAGNYHDSILAGGNNAITTGSGGYFTLSGNNDAITGLSENLRN